MTEKEFDLLYRQCCRLEKKLLKMLDESQCNAPEFLTTQERFFTLSHKLTQGGTP